MDLTYNKYDDAMRLLLSRMRQKLDLIYLGGGKQKLAQQHDQGKMTARERIEYLCDDAAEFLEIGAFAADGMYEEYGGCPAAGVIVGLGRVSGQLCVIVANDATVKAGAWFPMTAKKNLRAQEIALDNHLPIIYLVDSAGVFLPLQEDIFPDKEHFGRIFRNNARLSSNGILQVAAIMGSCVAGGAYLPIMSDESIIVEGTGSIFLAGPYLVKAAIGEEVDKELLGGAQTQTAISGIVDYKVKNDQEALDKIKSIIKDASIQPKGLLTRIKPEAPAKPNDEILGLMPADPAKPYDTDKILQCLVDQGKLTYYKPDYGKTISCAYARIGGWSVGLVANNRNVVKSAGGETQRGGVIYSDSADKAARFILLCNQKRIPLIFLHDVTGFMVGKRSEHGGIIKDGAKMVNAVANSTVPKLSIIIGNSFGAGNYAMCGKAYDPRFIVAWPTARIAVMGGEQAAKVLLQIQVTSFKATGKILSPEEETKLLQDITQKYNDHMTPYHAASRLWVDALIDPRETRQWIITGLEAANHSPIEPFKVGVIQV